MGLDNGFVLKNIGRSELSSWVRPIWDESMDEYEIQLAYFRKCWGIRGEILGVLHAPMDEYEFEVEVDDIIPIVKVLMKYLDKEYYDDNASSIWEYEEYYNNIVDSIINLMWLKSYMELHPDKKCYFYDSY